MADPKKVMVTGGAGYVGAHAAVQLVFAGHKPIVVDDLSRSNETLVRGAEKICGQAISFYKVDCKDKAALRNVFLENPDMGSVMHFAAFKSVGESVSRPLDYYQNNVVSLLTILELMEEFSVPDMVFSSSCTVYGQPEKIPVTEDTPFAKAESAYGATKQVCERILEDAVRSNTKLRVASLRYFNPIGAHPSGLIGELPLGSPNNLVPFITQTAIGKREKLVVFGNDYDTPDGSCLRDFIHVIDLADAHVKALEKIGNLPTRCEAINLGTGTPVSVLELIERFIKVTGVKLKYSIGPRRSGDIEKIYADSRKSARLLDWKTKLSVEDALRDAWNWEKRLSHEAH